MATIPRRCKVPAGPNQQPKDAVSVDVTDSKEPWSEYSLSDGTLLKIKLVLTEVWKIDNEYDADGNPAYVCKLSNVTNAIAPEALKRKSH